MTHGPINIRLPLPLKVISKEEETGESVFDYHHFPHKLSSPDSLASYKHQGQFANEYGGESLELNIYIY
jgi:hypothetical protein